MYSCNGETVFVFTAKYIEQRKRDMHVRMVSCLLFVVFMATPMQRQAYAFFESSVTEYKNGTSNDISGKTFEAASGRNALGISNTTTVTGRDVTLKADNKQEAGLVYMKNGGTLRLENAVLSGTNLKDSAIVLMHRLFSSDRPGTGLLSLKNGSVDLITDPSNTQPLIHVESTGSATPVSFQAESTSFHADRLNARQELFDVATYGSLTLTGTEDKRSSIVIDETESGARGIDAAGSAVDLSRTDITIAHGGGYGIFGMVTVNYPIADPTVTTSPSVTFRQGTISVDQGVGIAGVKGGTYRVERAEVLSKGAGIYLSDFADDTPFALDVVDSRVATAAGSDAALILKNVATVSSGKPDGAFTFSGSTLRSEGQQTVWIDDDKTGTREKRLQFTGSSVLNAAPETGTAFYLTGSNADVPTAVNLKDSTVEGNILSMKGSGATATFTLDGSTLTAGRVASGSGGTLDMRLTNASTAYAGAAFDNLSLDASSRWVLNSAGGTRNEATIAGLLDNDGGFAFERDRLPSLSRSVPSFSSFSKVTVRDLSGNGAFYMGVDVAEDKADSLIVTGNATGTHALYVTNSGAEPTRERMNAYLVKTGGGDAQFALGNAGAHVEAGLYLYELSHEAQGDSGTGWFLKRAITPVDPVDPPVDPVDPVTPPVTPVKPDEPSPVDPNPPAGFVLTPTAEVVLGLSGMAPSYGMWYGQLGNLRERLGEIRYGEARDGFWTRGFAQKDKLDGLDGIGVSQKVYGGSLGYDHFFQAGSGNRWLFGVRGQVSRADQDVNGRYGGSGNNHSYGVAGYATWRNRTGWYMDGVGTWDWYHQELKTRMLDGRGVKGDYHTYGGGLSLETGRSINLWGKAFLEPQAQVSYYWLKGGSFSTDNGMEVDRRDMQSLTGRFGLVLGKKWTLEENAYVQPYVKVGGIQEFLGSEKASVNGETFTEDMKGSRVYYGAGVDWQFADAAKLYGEVKRENGEAFSQSWSASVGFRYAF